MRELRAILAQIPGLSKNPKIISLAGGITNKNFRVDTNGRSYVLRLSDKSTRLLGISRSREYACARKAASVGVGAEVIRFLPRKGALVTRFIAGKAITSRQAASPVVLRRIVSSIRRYHKAPKFPGSFSPFATVWRYYALAKNRNIRFPATMGFSLSQMADMEKALKPKSLAPCHNDLLLGNFIDDGRIIRIVDWEYAAMGDPLFDLGNLAANCNFSDEADQALLKSYFGWIRLENLARLKLMKAVSVMRETMWGYLQSGISKIDFDFSGYAKTHHLRFLKYASTPNFSRWLKLAG